jgi:uncharacterized phiE125 gp8 family phage protein
VSVRPLLRPVLVTAPAATPITLEEAKRHCRIDTSDEDELIVALVDAATAYLDGWAGILGRCLVSQVWRRDFPSFPCWGWNGCGLPGDGALRLPFSPILAVTKIEYYDSANALTTLEEITDMHPAATLFVMQEDALSPYVASPAGSTTSWPTAYSRVEAVRVTATYGYGAASAVPEAIKQAMKLMVSHWYQNREAVATGSMAEMPMAVMALLSPFRRVFF